MVRRSLAACSLLALFSMAGGPAAAQLTLDSVFGAAPPSMQSFIDADRTNVDFMVYPRRTHSIAGIAQRRHLYGHMLQWWLAHL